ncbi:MAG TPA: hypothetical protein VK789_02155 [Bryobacteraceae bacterium]|jgi:hypothetical protein|nr:hypothetical protein [Bryobacteraceae bacterium]
MQFRHSWSLRHRSFILLAPSNETISHFPGGVTVSRDLHSHLLSESQRLRGRVYLADGAVTVGELDKRERHIQPLDSRSWHLLTLGSLGRVIGCTRFRRHPAPVSWSHLAIRQAAIAQSDEWGFRFRTSVDAELAAARRAGFAYVEVGGWALAREIRGTTMALKTVLATYAWSELLGGALGITTATRRNDSAAILRRLGGRPLHCDGVELPPYHDDRYGCTMEVLRFDSREPNPRYQAMLDEVKEQVATATVICANQPGADRHNAQLPEAFPLFESEIAC